MAGANSVCSILYALGANLSLMIGVLLLVIASLIALEVKARMRPASSGDAQSKDIDRVERDFCSTFPGMTWPFFEPGVTDG